MEKKRSTLLTNLTDIAQQFHSSSKLPHLTWLFPNAPHNHEANSTAWYTPGSFSPVPVGRSSSSSTNTTSNQDPEADEPPDEAEDEMLESVEYVCSLIDAEVSKGVKLARIVVGGFSQGCAISLMVALCSRYQGKLGGVVGLSGYLPQGGKIYEGRKRYSSQSEEGMGMKVFLAHGTRDMLVPMRVFRETRKRVQETVGVERVVDREYEGMGHSTGGGEFRDLCAFLEGVVG